jgi:hypothetical protein
MKATYIMTLTGAPRAIHVHSIREIGRCVFILEATQNSVLNVSDSFGF